MLLILLIAPYFGEGLSGSSPPLDLLLPWRLAFMAGLYGCGALVCREVARRFGLGFRGVILLAVAYGVWEEALVDRYWFFPTYWQDSGIGTYSVVWHTNVLLAVHLTLFHAVVSICCSVLVVEWLTPASRERAWVNRRGLLLALAVLAFTPVVYGEFDQRPPWPVLGAAAALLVSVVAVAFLSRPRVATAHRSHRESSNNASPGKSLGRRGLGVLAFAGVLTHWIVTYSLPATGAPWPFGVLLSVAPIALVALLIERLAVTGPYGADGVRSVTGIVSFFIGLDLVVGVNGRYDLIVSALITACAIRRLYRHHAKQPPPHQRGEDLPHDFSQQPTVDGEAGNATTSAPGSPPR